jgi:hypothetical protein
MAQFNITATSASKNQTVTNADTKTRKAYNSPAECADQAAADALATKFARDLNVDGYSEATDWIGQATPV